MLREEIQGEANVWQDSIHEDIQDVVPEGKRLGNHIVRRLEEEVGLGRAEGWRSPPLPVSPSL